MRFPIFSLYLSSINANKNYTIGVLLLKHEMLPGNATKMVLITIIKVIFVWCFFYRFPLLLVVGNHHSNSDFPYRTSEEISWTAARSFSYVSQLEHILSSYATPHCYISVLLLSLFDSANYFSSLVHSLHLLFSQSMVFTGFYDSSTSKICFILVNVFLAILKWHLTYWDSSRVSCLKLLITIWY